MPKPTKIAIHFGALADPIDKQLLEQNVRFTKEEAIKYQQLANAITFVHIHGLFPDASVVEARQRLLKRLLKRITFNA